LCLLIVISGFFFLLQNGFFGDAVFQFYELKKSEYDGVAQPLFTYFEGVAYLIRVFWNFIGVFGASWLLISEFKWNVFFNVTTQVALLAICGGILKAFLRGRALTSHVTLLLLFALATASWPLPHSRYLYPMVPAALWWIYCRGQRSGSAYI
jgi:hypothetical protein